MQYDHPLKYDNILLHHRIHYLQVFPILLLLFYIHFHINKKAIQIHQSQSIQILLNIYLQSVFFLLIKELWENQL